MDKKNLEEKLRSEGKRFAPNVLDKVYKSIGLEFSSSNKVIENKLMEEGKILTPNNYQNIAKEIKPTKKMPNGFLSFISHPVFISVSASLLVGVVAASIIIPIVVAKNNNGQVSDTLQLANENNVSLDLVSGSSSYQAKIKFVVDKNDVVDENSIVTYDDNSAYLIDNFGNKANIASSRANTNISSLDISSFTNSYLLTALNYGYLERSNINQANTLVFKIDSSIDNGAYYSKIKETLENDILNFSKNYKVVINYQIVEETSLDTSLLENLDPEVANKILRIYELSTSLFVGSKYVLSEAYFSDDVSDWINKFKDYEAEVLDEYISMLEFIDEQIRTREDIDRMIGDFYYYAGGYLEMIDYLNEFLPKIDARIKLIKAHLKVNGSDQMKELLAGNYKDLAHYLNENYAIRRTDTFLNENNEPSTEVVNWDYFTRVYPIFDEHGPHGNPHPGEHPGEGGNPHGPRRHMQPIYPFLEHLQVCYGSDEYEKSEYALYETYSDLQNLVFYRNNYIVAVDNEFNETLFWYIMENQYFSDWGDDYDHYQCEDDNWDNDFDAWWDDHHGGPHH